MSITFPRLARTEKGRLEQLKTFLRAHAGRLDMRLWLETSTEGGDTWGWRKKLRRKSLVDRMADFEACGSACCIGGAAEILTGLAGGTEAANRMGVRGPSHSLSGDLDVFYTSYWPGDLRKRYEEARGEKKFSEMTEVACEAIDYFNALPVK